MISKLTGVRRGAGVRRRVTRRQLAMGAAVVLLAPAVWVTRADAATTPTAPQNLTVSAGPTTGKMALSWDLVASNGGSNVVQYQVEHSVDGGPFAIIAQPTNRTPKVVCPAVTSCTYRVRARNGVGWGPFGGTATGTWAVPSGPKTSSVVAGPTTGNMTVKWAKPTSNGGKNLTGFVYEVQTDGVGAWDGPFAIAGSTGATRNAVLPCPSVTPTGGCRYRVLAMNSIGTGPAGLDKLGNWAVPAAPVMLAVEPGPTAGVAHIDYRAATSDGGLAVSHFTYDVSVDGGAFATGASILPASPSDAIVPCVAVLTCSYRVRAVNAKGSSGLSASLAAGYEAPNKPVNVTNAVTTWGFGDGTSVVTVSWDAPNDTGGAAITDYEGQLCIGYCNYDPALMDTQAIVSLGTGNAWAATCPAGEITCTYRIRSVTAFGASGWTQVNEFKPYAPHALTATTTTTAGVIQLDWVAPDQWEFVNANIVSLDLQYCVTTSGCSISGNWGPTGVAITPAALQAFHTCGNSVQCVYRLRALDSAGRYGLLSPAATATGASPASAPQNLTAVSSTTTIGAVNLDWDVPLDSGGFPVTDYVWRRAIGAAPFGAWTSLGSTVTDSVDTGCGASNACTYEVAAITAVGQGASSNQATAIGANVPSAPLSLAATTGFTLGAVDLTWAPPANDGGHPVTAYTVERSLDGGTTWPTSFALGVVGNYTDTTCGGSVTCTYRVTATNLMGTGAASNTAAADGADVASAPLALAATTSTDTLGEVDLTWSAPADDGGQPVTGYEFRVSTNAGAFTSWTSTATGVVTAMSHACDPSNNTLPDNSCTYEVRAVTVIGSGAASASATAAAFVDHVAPTVAITTPTNGSFTNDSTPTIAGTAGTALGDATTVTVVIKQGVTTIQTIPGVAVVAGAWSTTAAALGQGNYDVYAEQLDWAPNVGTSATINFDVDGTAPVLTITSPVGGDNLDGTSAITITGTSTDLTPPATAITVNVYTAASNCTGAVTSLSTTGTSWSVNDSVARGENLTLSIRAEQTDAALNFGQSACVAVATRQAFWVNKGTGNDANAGSKVAPFATIQAGIDAANASGTVKRVVVGNDTTYGSATGATLALASNVSIIGGFAISGSTWNRPGVAGISGTVAPSSTTFTAQSTGALADADTTVALDGVKIIGAAGTAAGSSTYGIRAINGSTVTLTNVDVTSGTGVAGTNGTNASGNAGNGTNGNGGASKTGNESGSGAGGSGGAGIGGRTGGTGGSGGSQGNNSGAGGGNGLVSGAGGGNGASGGGANGNCNDSPAGNGGNRTTAPTAGTAGSAGAAGSATLAGNGTATWSPAAGGSGGAPGHGHGGGGGGGGAGDGGSFISCVADGGAGGGGGGGGGGAGNLGTAGTGGGGSFAIYVHNSTVTITTATIVAGNGGNGGNGGAGSGGGIGGTGGTGGNCDTGQENGSGGGGGGGSGGGGGGGGGGGSGGPSIAIYENGTGTVSTASVTLTKGTQGAIGAGGTGGAGGAAGGGGTRGNSGAAELSNSNGCYAGQNGGAGVGGGTGGTGGAGSGGSGFALRSYIDGASVS